MQAYLASHPWSIHTFHDCTHMKQLPVVPLRNQKDITFTSLHSRSAPTLDTTQWTRQYTVK